MAAQSREISNFGANVRFTPQNHFTPASEGEVLEILSRFRGHRFRVIGRLHAWSPAAASDDGDPTSEPWYAISFISYARPDQRDGFFRFTQIATDGLAKLFVGRPRWGKHCPLTARQVRELYSLTPAFRTLCRQADLHGAFQSDWTRKMFGDKRPAV